MVFCFGLKRPCLDIYICNNLIMLSRGGKTFQNSFLHIISEMIKIYSLNQRSM